VTPDGNSIFVFEAGGLCIGHLGHLHHEPTPEDFALLGRMDVVMVPVDGGYTLPQEALVRTLERLRARIVIPMHWFGPATLDSFLASCRSGRATASSGARGARWCSRWGPCRTSSPSWCSSRGSCRRTDLPTPGQGERRAA
jgi:hypothetical protein